MLHAYLSRLGAFAIHNPEPLGGLSSPRDQRGVPQHAYGRLPVSRPALLRLLAEVDCEGGRAGVDPAVLAVGVCLCLATRNVGALQRPGVKRSRTRVLLGWTTAGFWSSLDGCLTTGLVVRSSSNHSWSSQH